MATSPYTAREQARWLTENASRFIRPDAARFFKPGTNLENVFPALALKYNPNQPRVPSGNPDGGQWTDGNGSGRPRVIIDTTYWTREGTTPQGNGDGSASGDGLPYDTRLASNEDKPKLGQNSRVAILAEIGRRLVRAFRSENGLFDLFNHDTGTVSHLQIDGRDIFGSNSTSPTYKSQDREAADRMRDILVDKYPDKVKVDDIGQKPNDALYHAETNVLLRSAKESGGTLAGRSIEIYVDRPFCNSCKRIVPLVGLELGNPEITIVDPQRVFIITNGKVTSQRSR